MKILRLRLPRRRRRSAKPASPGARRRKVVFGGNAVRSYNRTRTSSSGPPTDFEMGNTQGSSRRDLTASSGHIAARYGNGG
jgi:hypothetical protein